MKLTDKLIQSAKPMKKSYKLTDGNGLYLAVSTYGAKSWRYDYRFTDLRKTLTLGTYPSVSLKQARSKLLDAKKLLEENVDPSEQKRSTRLGLSIAAINSFEIIAREWFEMRKSGWVKGHRRTIISRLERDVFPFLGRQPVTAINSATLLSVLRKIEARGAIETAHRVLQICDQIFRYAVVTARASNNPAVNLRGALQPARSEHLAAITDPKEVGGLMRSIDDYKDGIVVRLASYN